MNLEKIYPVRKLGDKYFVLEEIRSRLEPKFMAISPNIDEMFLLLGDYKDCELLKGSLEEGLRFRKLNNPVLFDDGFIIHIGLDNLFVPNSLEKQRPRWHDLLLSASYHLILVPFEVIPQAASRRRL